MEPKTLVRFLQPLAGYRIVASDRESSVAFGSWFANVQDVRLIDRDSLADEIEVSDTYVLLYTGEEQDGKPGGLLIEARNVSRAHYVHSDMLHIVGYGRIIIIERVRRLTSFEQIKVL